MSELQLKMKLSSLVDLTFKLPTRERHISFEAVAAHCKIPNEQVKKKRSISKRQHSSILKLQTDSVTDH